MSYADLIRKLDGSKAVFAVSKALQRIDDRLISHGERVAFIAGELCDLGGLPLDEERLFQLCLFHDIGAYKTEEIDRMVEFETVNVQDHAIYGYLFLKHMSPIDDMCEAILYHHSPWYEIKDDNGAWVDYAALIHLADRLDIIHLNRKDAALVGSLTANERQLFRPEYVELAIRCNRERRLFERLADGTYKTANEQRIRQYHIPAERVLEFLRMMVYSIDFRSEYTVTHTVNTVAIALDIARYFQLSDEEMERIYLGALLHDVGKISVPLHILESQDRLSEEEMAVMRGHVDETRRIIVDLVPDDIFLIAVRHHEKLDGSGYPLGLKAESLDFSQRIVAVADIVSALCGRRSYKEPFPKDKIIRILKEMCGEQLDSRICHFVCEEYDSIIARTDMRRNEVIVRYQAMLDEYEQLRERV